MCTKKLQQPSLDKKAFRKGDPIKGRIEIEVLDEFPKYPARPPRPITVKGVFESILK